MSISNYTNAKHLEGMILTIWGEVSREHPGNGKGKGVGTYKAEAKRCALLYGNAASKERSFVVLGESSIRGDSALMANLGTISTNPVLSKKHVKASFQKVYPYLGRKIDQAVQMHITQGAVLNEGNWFILPNDIFMLGVIHSGKECHIATENGEIPEKEILWDEDADRPRVLGRELLQLYEAGFRVVEESLNGHGIQLLLVDENKSQLKGLLEIRQAGKTATLEMINNIFIDTVAYNETVKGKNELVG